MELAGELHRTPRETLATVSMNEFFAYVRLGRDRAADHREAEDEARRNARRHRRGGGGPSADDVVDLTTASDEDVASAFGAKIVRVKVGGAGS